MRDSERSITGAKAVHYHTNTHASTRKHTQTHANTNTQTHLTPHLVRAQRAQPLDLHLGVEAPLLAGARRHGVAPLRDLAVALRDAARVERHAAH